jgi:hypothetical protein
MGLMLWRNGLTWRGSPTAGPLEAHWDPTSEREHPGTGQRMRAVSVHCVPCRRDIRPRLWWLHAWRRHGRRPWRRYA